MTILISNFDICLVDWRGSGIELSLSLRAFVVCMQGISQDYPLFEFCLIESQTDFWTLFGAILLWSPLGFRRKNKRKSLHGLMNFSRQHENSLYSCRTSFVPGRSFSTIKYLLMLLIVPGTLSFTGETNPTRIWVSTFKLGGLDPMWLCQSIVKLIIGFETQYTTQRSGVKSHYSGLVLCVRKLDVEGIVWHTSKSVAPFCLVNLLLRLIPTHLMLLVDELPSPLEMGQ